MLRTCQKPSCAKPATRTLTYVHADACVVIGPLSARREPGAHDLCEDHASRLKAPRGWQLISLQAGETPPQRTRDDLLAIADAVREAAAPPPEPAGRTHGHLRVIGESE